MEAVLPVLKFRNRTKKIFDVRTKMRTSTKKINLRLPSPPPSRKITTEKKENDSRANPLQFSIIYFFFVKFKIFSRWWGGEEGKKVTITNFRVLHYPQKITVKIAWITLCDKNQYFWKGGGGRNRKYENFSILKLRTKFIVETKSLFLLSRKIQRPDLQYLSIVKMQPNPCHALTRVHKLKRYANVNKRASLLQRSPFPLFTFITTAAAATKYNFIY